MSPSISTSSPLKSEMAMAWVSNCAPHSFSSGTCDAIGSTPTDRQDKPKDDVVIETIDKIVANLGAGDIDRRLEEQLVDGLTGAAARPRQLARGAAGVAGVSLAVEMFVWAERHPDSAFTSAFRRPGSEIQRLIATREPTAQQLEVGTAALTEVLRMESMLR